MKEKIKDYKFWLDLSRMLMLFTFAAIIISGAIVAAGGSHHWFILPASLFVVSIISQGIGQFI